MSVSITRYILSLSSCESFCISSLNREFLTTYPCFNTSARTVSAEISSALRMEHVFLCNYPITYKIYMILVLFDFLFLSVQFVVAINVKILYNLYDVIKRMRGALNK